MVNEKVEQAMGVAVAHHQAGRFAQAEQIYRQVLAAQPSHAEALHLLGVIAGQAGQHQAAAELIRKAINVSPRNAVYHSNLGMSLLNLSQIEAAITAFKRAITLDPNNAETHFRIATVYYGTGQLDASILDYQRAITINPNYFDALHNFGNALITAQQYNRAIDICKRAIALNGSYPPTHNNLGNACKGKGNLAEAIASYRRALLLDPNYAEAHNNLGNTLQDTEEFDLAIASYKRAIELNPQNAEFHCNLGAALMGKGEVDQAIEAYQQSLALNPNYVKSLCNLAIAWTEKEELEKAIENHEKAIAIEPDYFDSLLNLGAVHVRNKHPKKAIVYLERALVLNPNSAEVYNNLGVVHRSNGDLDKSIAGHERAIALKPDFVEAYNNLGNALKDKNLLPAAIAAYTRALEIDPNHVKVMAGLAGAWKQGMKIDQALALYEKAASIQEDDGDSIEGQASVHMDAGSMETAIRFYRRALELDPDRWDWRQGLLFSHLYSARTTPQEILAEHTLWNKLHAAESNKKIKPFTNTPDPGRRLRVGYVSGDFRMHSVNYFFQPLLESLDKTNLDIYCYSSVPNPDAVTQQLQAAASVWRDIKKLDDDEAADLIRADQIDILIEMTGHTAHSRLQMLAQKPAPVQASFLGYPATTGLSTIDFRISDIYADPPGLTDDHYTESLCRMPRTAWCYRPPADATAVAPTPALASSIVTFGSFNFFGKVSDDILDCWMRILKAVPASRLVIKSKNVSSNVSSQRVHRIARLHDIALDRIDLVDWIPPAEHYNHFGRIDIALDSFPYHGTTTTCETLWMGLPVITLAGQTHVSRVGVSLMTNIGLPQLIADSPDHYVQIAADLAGDIPRLADLRAGMRERMLNSPLMDSETYARDMEKGFRSMWQKWCASR